MLIYRLIRHILTDADNQTFDTTRVCFVIAFLFSLVAVSFSVLYRNSVFDVQSFGIGMGALTGAFGLSKKMEG